MTFIMKIYTNSAGKKSIAIVLGPTWIINHRLQLFAPLIYVPTIQYFSIMKRYLVIAAIFAFVACNANTAEKNGGYNETLSADAIGNYATEDVLSETKGDKDDKKEAKADTFCYVMSDGENNENINAVKLIIKGDKVTGELKYITANEPPAVGQLNGTIKDGIITADWTFVKQSNYYKVPVAFKMTNKAIFQKPSAVNQDGQAYIPEEGEYSYEFPLVNCEYYPQ